MRRVTPGRVQRVKDWSVANNISNTGEMTGEVTKKGTFFEVPYFGDSTGNRTRVTAVKGRCLDRLTMEPIKIAFTI